MGRGPVQGSTLNGGTVSANLVPHDELPYFRDDPVQGWTLRSRVT